jgi:putative membrane protein
LPAQADTSESGDPRVYLAIERTFLAWTRTALALMGFGFVVARIGLFLRELANGDSGGAVQRALLAQPSHSLWLGTALVVLGILVQGFALLEHRHRVRQFRRNAAFTSRRWSLSAFVGIALIGIGVAIAAYLTRLFLADQIGDHFIPARNTKCFHESTAQVRAESHIGDQLHKTVLRRSSLFVETNGFGNFFAVEHQQIVEGGV